MDIGVYILGAGFAAGFVELFVLVWFSSREKEKWQRFSEIFAGLSTLFLAVALVLLMRYFLTDNFSFTYVVEHSQADSPALIKLSGVWSGQEGSLLLWAVLISFFAFLYKSGQKKVDEPRDVQLSYIVLAIVNLVFILFILMDSPFKTQRAVLDGYGLNPLLRTKWNVIHPVIVFGGYAATTVPFAIALSQLFSRTPINRHQKMHQDFHMAIAWLFLSLGIILGGYWAYITLGWGGYWAWDPVETASLIPWILCTAYFHTKPIYKSESRIPSTLAAVPFITVLYAAYITRGGSIQSVHAFAESPVILGIIMLLVGSFVVMIIPFALRPLRIRFSLVEFQKMSLYKKSMEIAFLCLIALAIVCFLGIFIPLLLFIATGVQYSVEPAFYTYGCSPFTLILIISLISCHITRFKKAYDLKSLGRIIIPPIVLGVLLFFLNIPTYHGIANFGIPILAVAVGISLYRMLQSSFSIEAFDRAIRESSRSAIHAGLAIILLGAFISSTTQLHENDGQTFEVILGRTTLLETTGISIRVFDTQYLRFTSELDFEMLVTIGVIEGGSISLKSAHLLVDPNYLTASGEPRLYAFPAIFHSLWRDIYVSVVGISQNNFLLRVSVMPFVSLVWIGSILLCVGIVPLLGYRGKTLLASSPPTAHTS
ncbi:MAG: cytochrome c biogenesis protein CcsA [Candidatus Heimdallarchaeota archaeon]